MGRASHRVRAIFSVTCGYSVTDALSSAIAQCFRRLGLRVVSMWQCVETGKTKLLEEFGCRTEEDGAPNRRRAPDLLRQPVLE
jgi:hypothetical protein